MTTKIEEQARDYAHEHFEDRQSIAGACAGFLAGFEAGRQQAVRAKRRYNMLKALFKGTASKENERMAWMDGFNSRDMEVAELRAAVRNLCTVLGPLTPDNFGENYNNIVIAYGFAHKLLEENVRG